MKNTTFLSIFVAIAFCLCGCNSDDESDLSSVERSLVGYWQVVERFSSDYPEPINGIPVMEFKSDRTQSFYQDGELQYETQFWAKPTGNEDVYYLYHQPDEEYLYSYCEFEIVGNILTIWESGCLFSRTVYQRIPSLNAADPEAGAFKYEDNPTTLEGTWHLAKANFSFGGIYEFEPGDVTVRFFPNHVMSVINKSKTMEMKPFMDSGSYSYDIIKTETNKYDGTVFTTINLNGQQCTYWFKDGMMTLDYGMTYDAPGFYFKKLKFTNQ